MSFTNASFGSLKAIQYRIDLSDPGKSFRRFKSYHSCSSLNLPRKTA